MKITLKLRRSLAMALVVTIISAASTAQAITIKEEEELSRQFMKVLLKRFDIIKDPVIVGYVNKVGKKILSAMPPQPFTYHFYVIREDVYNAFATPAGHIFINSGLFAAMEDENELAGILGHEIAHVVCRHISQKIERQKKMQLATLAGLAAGLFLGVGGAGTAAEALTIGSMAAAQSAELAFSREDETQADELGLQYLSKAGYSGDGLVEMLKKIRSMEWFSSTDVPTYLRTHPASEERLIMLSSRLDNQAKADRSAKGWYNTEFMMAHTRLQALYTDPEKSLQIYSNQVRRDPQDLYANYGYALSLERNDKWPEAIEAMRRTLAKNAFNGFFLADLGRMYFYNGQFEDARRALKEGLRMVPDNWEALFYMGRVQLKNQQPQEAVRTFKELLARVNGYTDAYYFLGEALSKSSQPAQAHYYLGIYYMEKHQRANAIFQLERARQIETDPERKKAIDKRLDELKGKEQNKKKQPSRGIRLGQSVKTAW